MTDPELAAFRKHPKRLLIDFVSGDKPTSARHIAAKLELERRAGRFSRGMSIASFIVSLVAIAIALLSVRVANQSLDARKGLPIVAPPPPASRSASPSPQ